jgi:hypothetical protein
LKVLIACNSSLRFSKTDIPYLSKYASGRNGLRDVQIVIKEKDHFIGVLRLHALIERVQLAATAFFSFVTAQLQQLCGFVHISVIDCHHDSLPFMIIGVIGVDHKSHRYHFLV